MGRPISFFTDYHQEENRVTNYCGLILKILYQESPLKFEQAIQALSVCDALSIGPQFQQQTKKNDSVPDLEISQSSFSIFFETKLTDWFKNDQIESHIKGLGDAKQKILLLLSNFETDDYVEKKFSDLVQRVRSIDKSISISAISFEDILEALDEVEKSDNLEQLVGEFREYLDRKGLLPNWKYLLDVVNCAGTMEEIASGFYICPATGGTYSHKRARYFGPYKNKQVSAIHEVNAVVVVAQNKESVEIKWNNSARPDSEIYAEAHLIIKKWDDWRIEENKRVPLQIFILGGGIKTNFVKNSPGGMMGSKKYFWDIARNVSDAEELAANLSGTNWDGSLIKE